MLIEYFDLLRAAVPFFHAEGARLLLIYIHLLLCAFAITAVLVADIKIAVGTFTRQGLKKSAHGIAWILFALWITGLVIIYLDTGFDPDILITKTKLLFKLLSVVVLTLNGIVLHKISFPIISRCGELSLRESILLVLTGALSTSHWLLAAFVGVSKPLGKLPLEALLGFYAVYCAVTLFVALMFIPMLNRRLSDWHRSHVLGHHGNRTLLRTLDIDLAN